MPYALSSDDVQSIMTALCGDYDFDIGRNKVRLLARSLPGGAVCSILPDLGDHVLRIVYDLSKPNAFRHAQAMVGEWWESFRQPVAFPDGSVEMLNLPCPRPDEGPVKVAVLLSERRD